MMRGLIAAFAAPAISARFVARVAFVIFAGAAVLAAPLTPAVAAPAMPAGPQALAESAWPASNAHAVAASPAATPAVEPVRNWIELFNTHTNETLKITFRDEAGALIPEALDELNRICGDHRSKEHRKMDAGLFVLLVDLAAAAGTEPRYDIISAFRSSASNEKLRANGGGQAKNSQHIEGKAMDVRLKGVTTERLRDLARALERGGVGYYPKSGFVHVDTARVRYWEG
jgi:uncharacterized protein YcbK (DUF882 family)